MDLKALETKWRTALSSILDELTDDEFRKLLFNLEKIPQGVKGGRPRGDMPSVIIQYYGTEGSIALIDRLMKILPRLDAAVQQPLRGMKDELKKLRVKKKGTKPATDSGAVPKKKKPAAAATSNETDSGAATKKKKPVAEVSGGSAETQIMKQDSTLNPQAPQGEAHGSRLNPNPAWFLPTPKKVPVGAVEPQQKEPAGATPKPKDQSAAPVQMNKIKVITLIRTNNTNTHLKVQLGGRPRKVYGTTQVLSDGMGFKTVEEFNKGFFTCCLSLLTANMQGKRILEMRMI
ncbi:Ubiquinone/menaquinone biosynthesis C-methyltransferase UbiE [Dissostichus eleginoides]|uniref:Ubiquinone/menaquinone biosynthesis C-methyltransferase UbiE n=1 Tax=Dissostichus eleginoides TaxID=100907 RepID=A0AAD9B607_DISEL|nr:Ubiquinone/menaquinone biosynthesis C-methyltransferase UbiE [Dissostichus eleginoides]